MSKRIETDTFGKIEVDSNKYWGAQSQRSLKNFDIGWEIQPKSIIKALGIIKAAAAEVNMKLGILNKDIGQNILKKTIKELDYFIIDEFKKT